VAIARADAKTMVDIDAVAISAVDASRSNLALGRAINTGTCRPGEIEAGMKGEMTVERVNPAAKRALFRGIANRHGQWQVAYDLAQDSQSVEVIIKIALFLG